MREKSKLDEFYEAAVNNKLEDLHLYLSDIYYIRAFFKYEKGLDFSLEHIQEAVTEFEAERKKSDVGRKVSGSDNKSDGCAESE